MTSERHDKRHQVTGISGAGVTEVHHCYRPDCDREFASTHALIDHMVDEHGATSANTWGCSKCDQTFPTKVQRDTHEDMGHRLGALPEPARPCSPRKVPAPPQLADTFTMPAAPSHVDQPEADDGRFRCHWQGCTASYDRKDNLSRHITMKHGSTSDPLPGDKICTVLGCGRTFGSPGGLATHVGRMHKREPDTAETKLHAIADAEPEGETAINNIGGEVTPTLHPARLAELVTIEITREQCAALAALVAEQVGPGAPRNADQARHRAEALQLWAELTEAAAR